MNLRSLLILVTIALAGVSGAAIAQTPAATAPVTVHIKNFKFVPASLTIAAGTAVTFVNDDTEPHTATATDKSFDSEGLDTNGTWTHTFTKPGTIAYFCEMHPYMKGTLIVKAAP